MIMMGRDEGSNHILDIVIISSSMEDGLDTEPPKNIKQKEFLLKFD
jgi:hypothetical protein